MFERYIGLDVGGTKCAVLLAEVDNGIKILDKIRFDTHAERGFEYAYNLLCEGISEIIARNNVDISRVRAIGVSCGGPLDSRKGIVLCPPNLPGWVNIPLTDMLSQKFGVPCFLQNDANACALVEWRLGAGRGTRDMIFLTMGTGMGAGVIIDGRLLVGANCMGGEIGHLRLSDDGPVGFGKEGSFEGWASGGGIARYAMSYAKMNHPVWENEDITTKLLAEYARKGDADAIKIFEKTGEMLGKGLALLVDSFNPECIVIGSVFARCEDLIRPTMEVELKKEAIPFSLQVLKVVPAGTGEAIGDYASIMAALYELGVDPMESKKENNPRVMAHFDRLFERYPTLEKCKESVMQAYELLLDSYTNGKKLMVVGNGGSCADCEHIVGEMMKGFYLKRPLKKELREEINGLCADILPNAGEVLQQGMPAIALTGHAALSTAVQNDCDPNIAAAQQIIGYGEAGDTLIGISTSGGAKNVALAVCVAKAKGIHTIGLTGGNGGRLANLVDCAVIAPANTPADVQEYHLPIYHTLCAMLEAKFFEA